MGSYHSGSFLSPALSCLLYLVGNRGAIEVSPISTLVSIGLPWNVLAFNMALGLELGMFVFHVLIAGRGAIPVIVVGAGIPGRPGAAVRDGQGASGGVCLGL